MGCFKNNILVKFTYYTHAKIVILQTKNGVVAGDGERVILVTACRLRTRQRMHLYWEQDFDPVTRGPIYKYTYEFISLRNGILLRLVH